MSENNFHESHPAVTEKPVYSAGVPAQVKYEDNNFKCEIISSDAKFITETLDNMFNEQGTAKELADLLAGIEIPPAVQEKINLILNKIKANTEKVSEAVKENS